jgi:hypothetical protein
VTDEALGRDRAAVERDLQTLKELLEGGGAGQELVEARRR